MNISSIDIAAGKLKLAATYFLLAVVGLDVGQSSAVASIVQNGSFEFYSGGTVTFSSGVPGVTRFDATPSQATGITGWTLAGTTADNVVLHHAPHGPGLPGIAPVGSNYRFANDGDTYLDLSGGDNHHATIYQDMDTTPGQSYLLSFFLGASKTPTNTINVKVDGALPLLNQTLTAPAAGANINWQQFSFTFIADSLLTRLSFKDTSILGTHGSANNDNSYVDSVSVTEVGTAAVPEPGSLVLWLAITSLTTCGVIAKQRA